MGKTPIDFLFQIKETSYWLYLKRGLTSSSSDYSRTYMNLYFIYDIKGKLSEKLGRKTKGLTFNDYDRLVTQIDFKWLLIKRGYSYWNSLFYIARGFILTYLATKGLLINGGFFKWIELQ